MDIENCQISNWPNLSAAFELSRLDLDKNKMASLPSNHGLPSNNVLASLYLAHNKFGSDFTSYFLEGLPKLRQLSLYSVGATLWPNISQNIHQFEVLNVANNNFGTIDVQSLLGVDHLTFPELLPGGPPLMNTLHSRYMRITHFPEELFAIFPNIKVLRLTKNYLSNVPNFEFLQQTLQSYL